MLKPPVVAAGIARQRTPVMRDQLDRLAAEAERHGRGLGGISESKGERFRIIFRCSIEVRDRNDDAKHGIDRRLRTSLRRRKRHPEEKRQSADHWGLLLEQRRSSRRSPTRKALAMIVRVGFTAALDTKKLASTT